MLNKSENGIIFDIKRFSVNDGPGIRTTIFFKGCPLSCWWCHNPEGKQCHPEISERTNRIGKKEFTVEERIGNEMSLNQVMNEILKDNIVYEESGGGVTFSGGEPFYQFEFLRKLLKYSKSMHINTVIDTSGYTSKENIMDILDYTDLFLFDIKHLDNDEHLKYTGVSNFIILDNLNFIIQNGKKVILRMPVIPGLNDTPENKKSLKDIISMYTGYLNELHLLPYHNAAMNKYKKLNVENKLKELPGLRKNDLNYLKEEFESLGIKVKIGG
jgi:pyruvate formate lyase activating enzyme